MPAFFELLPQVYLPEKVRYVHSCRGQGSNRPTAVPARFVMACGNGHLDDFPSSYFAHRGTDPGAGHSLKLSERGSTGAGRSAATPEVTGGPSRHRRRQIRHRGT